jgi:hypothetical protein
MKTQTKNKHRSETKGLKIRLEDRYIPILRNRGLNGGVLRQSPFEFMPSSFTSAIEGLKPKVFSRNCQIDMLDSFLESPFEPINYCIVSAPDDGKAKLLAAYMMQHALACHDSRTALPMWVDLTGGFDNPLVVNKVKPSLLVINNVGVNSTQPKMEKLRDILEVYSDVPRIVVATGTDPYMFFLRYLYLPIHAVCYLTNKSVQKIVQL